MKSPLMKWLGMAAWLITGLAAVGVGLVPFGYNFFMSNFMLGQPGLVAPIQYIVLASGIISLLMMGMACTSNGCGCCGNPNH
jgi:hypothetical protein